MQTTQREAVVRVDGKPGPPARTNRWLVAAVVVLALALVAVGTWVVIDRSSNATLPATDVADIMDRSVAAWNDGDTEEVLALYAGDAVFTDGETTLNGENAIADYVGSLHGLGFIVDTASTPIVTGNTSSVAVAYGAPGDLSSAVAVLELNADGLIVRHTVMDISGVRVTSG